METITTPTTAIRYYDVQITKNDLHWGKSRHQAESAEEAIAKVRNSLKAKKDGMEFTAIRVPALTIPAGCGTGIYSIPEGVLAIVDDEGQFRPAPEHGGEVRISHWDDEFTGLRLMDIEITAFDPMTPNQ